MWPLWEFFFQSWDLLFKEFATSDYVVGECGHSEELMNSCFDQERARLDFPKINAALKRMSERWPKAQRKFVVEKANGSALIATLRHQISGLVAVNPEVDKVSDHENLIP